MPRLDFNRQPYNDDFDPTKNYMKVLFRSGVPVQARELNTLQSTLQHQIESFANHIFKNGSKVSGARTALSAKSYVRLRNNYTATGTPVNLELFEEGTRLVGVVSGIQAILVKGVNAENGDPPTMYVVYTTTGIDGERDEFIPGETINILDENNIVAFSVDVRCPSCEGSSETDDIASIGKGMIFTIDEGVFYYEGMFVNCPRQDIIVHKYLLRDDPDAPIYPDRDKMSDGTIAPEPCKIGLDFVQTIVTHQDDPTLLDPSLGYPNSTAPGAHRYKVDLILVKRSYAAEDGENFVLLCRIGEQMLIEYIKSESEYSEIMDMIAKRTYETNGNYTIRPFRVSFYEHKKDGPTDAKGWSLSGNEDSIVALMSPSVGYVKGYRVETVNNTPIRIKKARDTKVAPGATKYIPERTYITLKVTSGVPWPNDNGSSDILSVRKLEFKNASASTIGFAYVSDMSFVEKDGADMVCKFYIFGLTMSPGHTLSSVTDVTSAVSGGFASTPVLDPTTERFEIYNPQSMGLVYQLPRSNVATLRDAEDPDKGSFSITLRKKLKGTLLSGNTVSFSATTNQSFAAVTSQRTIVWTNNGGTFKSYVVGTPDISIVNDGITLSITIPGDDISGGTITVLLDVIHTVKKEASKVDTEADRVETAVLPLESYAVGATFDLGVYDASQITLIQRRTGTGPYTYTDVTSEFILDRNVNDYSYGKSMIRRVRAGSFQSNEILLIDFRHFTNPLPGFFTVDSFDVGINPGQIPYEDLPVYTMADRTEIRAADALDFRFKFDVNSPPGTTIPGELPVPGSTAIFDMEYYLHRADLILINKEGNLYTKQGQPSESPRPPKPDEDAMALYEVWLNAYTYNLNDVASKFIENKRYTMRDIGRLESRIENLEYYTALNLLEKSAADMSIKDENGLDRFKNGFIADNFQDFQAADLQNLEFRAAVDRGDRELRPRFTSRNHRLTIDKTKCSDNIKWFGPVAMMNYSEVIVDSNPFATKHISINPYYQFNRKGVLTLSPNNDVWSDTTRLPAVVTDIDTGVDEFRRLATAAGMLGTDWGSWIDQNQTILGSTTTVSNNTSSNTWINTGANQAVTTTTTTQTTSTSTTISTGQVRTGTRTTVEARTTGYSIEDIVKDVQIIPYIRETDVEFYARKMKANTRVYAFFDGVAVSEFCQAINFTIDASTPEPETLVTFGSELITDANGEIIGRLRIPGGRFFTGEKRFKLSDDPSGNSDPDIETTNAETSFFAGGLDVTKQDATLNIITPMFDTEEVSETRNVVTTQNTRETEVIDEQVDITELPVPPPVIPPPPPPPPTECCPDECWTLACYCAKYPNCAKCRDPVAQAFITSRDMFVTAVDVFFKSIDTQSDKVFCELRQMVNGYPSNVILASKTLDLSDLKDSLGPDAEVSSEDATIPVKFTFDIPTFLEGNTQYCFVIGGFSPNTRIWIAHLGEEVINMPGKLLEMSPTGQPSFRSLNGTTWNAEQFQTIKYNLHAASFATGEMKLGFNLLDKDKINRWPLEDNPFEMESGSNRIRVFASDHGFSVGDTVQISVNERASVTMVASGSGVPRVGQMVSSGGSSAIIDEIVLTPTPGRYTVKLKNTSGPFAVTGTSPLSAEVQSMTKSYRDQDLLKLQGFKNIDPVPMQAVSCELIAATPGNVFPNSTYAGIPTGDLNKTHTILAVDSMDSFIIQVSTTAISTGRFGGDKCALLTSNEKYELFNVSGAYLPYNSVQTWSLTGIGYARDNRSPFYGEDSIPQEPRYFQVAEDNYLGQPWKIKSANPDSVKVEARFYPGTSLVSPVVNTDTFSVTTVSNRVEWLYPEDFEIDPNANGRFVHENDHVATGGVYLDAIRGTELFKYVTKDVRLAEPANDLMIYFDVYRDKDADFDVYVKTVSPYDSRSLDEVPWTRLDITKTRFSSDLTDRIEYEIKCSDPNINRLIWSGVAEEAVDWPEEEPFSAFKVKLVGKTKNSAKPPTFRSLRAIAIL